MVSSIPEIRVEKRDVLGATKIRLWWYVTGQKEN